MPLQPGNLRKRGSVFIQVVPLQKEVEYNFYENECPNIFLKGY